MRIKNVEMEYAPQIVTVPEKPFAGGYANTNDYPLFHD
jgi:hypothetical protein